MSIKLSNQSGIANGLTFSKSVGKSNLRASEYIPKIEYLVIAGGGGGGSIGTGAGFGSGGGGAGGYRSSVINELSGGGASAETPLILTVGETYTVTIGAGGSGVFGSATNGENSVFSSITSLGGGRGNTTGFNQGADGGSGGGNYGGTGGSGGSGEENQGYNGGRGGSGEAGIRIGGGGGGAGEAGNTDSQGNGGDGVVSSITGTSETRGGGGGGGNGLADNGGDGGGGDGKVGTTGDGESGVQNTGGGGGGAFHSGGVTRNGGNGGSGVVILRYPSKFSITFSEGLTASTTTIGYFKVTEFTEGDGTIQFTK